MGKRGRNRELRNQRRAQKRAEQNKERQEKRFQEEIVNEARDPIIHLPEILGSDFRAEPNDLSAIRAKIDALPKSDYRRRVLFCSEASFLKTGFSTYAREVLKRLHATGKYEIAEFGSYGSSPDMDQRAKDIPWKYYHNLPSNSVEEAEYKKDYRENQFGKWRLPFVLADFKPDIVIDIRDHWMIHFEVKTPFRDNHLVFWMPTVDGYPQKWDWLYDYSKVDSLFTYSWFGKKVLEEQSKTLLAKRGGLKQLYVKDVIQPGVDTNIFKPINKNDAKAVFGIPNKLRFVGTVMRNQPRKLFTRIIDSFRIFKQKYPVESKDVLLLLHTSIPDVGWDIPEAVRQNGLEDFVVFSYICFNCGACAISTFNGSPTKCPKCGQNSFHTPNTQVGYSDEHFNIIYNVMDAYIQGSIAEGDGMPVNEAKACGVPVLASDYSALYEKNRNGGAIPINNDTIYTEHETMQWRSLFDRNDLASKLASVMGNEAKREKLSREARDCAEKYYNWDLCSAKWEYEIDTAKIKDRNNTWNKPIEIKEITPHSPPDLPNNRDGYKDWLTWCYVHILGRKGIDAQGLQHWTRSLESAQDKNKAKSELEKHFRSMIESENASKQILANPSLALTDPIARVKSIVDEIEASV